MTGTYVVAMFPYPSGDLHMGHAEAYCISDAIARYRRLRGDTVLHPIGWDSFGLPAENAARKRGEDPREWTYANIETQAESLRQLGIAFDWSTRLHTSDPSFYRWNQWLFLQLFHHGLAYRAEAEVNWCPRDSTVLANEQVIGGRCERCATAVVRKPLTQWFFRTTAYARRLLDDMAQLEGNWPAAVLTMQRNWIGRDKDGYRLHDWLISRQRYWGTPIPIVHCRACGAVAVDEADLPVLLPADGFELQPEDGRSPLATASAWLATRCPRCGGPAERDTDTMDTFVDSSWYFLRYPNASYPDGPFDPDGIARWLPVDHYIGGRTHATGHLIYARFMTKVLYDLGHVPFVEPFRRLTTQGQVTLRGKAMSKSLGNIVRLRDQIATYGPDAVRVTMLFAGPPQDDIDWADVVPAGAVNWLARLNSVVDGPLPDTPLPAQAHRLIAATTEAMERLRFNVAIARLMELTTLLRTAPTRSGTRALLQMVSCFAPFTAQAGWARIGETQPIGDWPAADAGAPAESTATCVVQVDGKLRARLTVPASIGEADLRAIALAAPAVAAAVAARAVTTVILRPPRLVNVVTAADPSASGG
jgi:leucyl-tRNA synthetase